MRQILLVEPDYPNKYPPLGLMKISTYHKLLGDEVVFVKGMSKAVQMEKWDRIYVTTLFSFFWSRTIETIKFYKRSVFKTKDFFIGGIMATILKDEIEKEVGLRVYQGILDQPGILDPNDIIVDTLPADYDILEQIEYVYPEGNSYLAYSTRGCINRCPFCAVPLLEPCFADYQPGQMEKIVKTIDAQVGPKRNLLLLDNNVLGSTHFNKIVNEIKSLGFERGKKFQEPNLFDVYFARLKKDPKDRVASRKLQGLLASFSEDRLGNFPKAKAEFLELTSDETLFDCPPEEFFRKVAKIQKSLSPLFEKYRNKAWKMRSVDFNQGIDIRLLTEKKMKKLSEICIAPLRLAFDHIRTAEKYKETVRWASKYGIQEISNYLLYNYDDDPEDLYLRMRINIDLNNKLGTKIYSFPMKYIPVKDKDRSYVGPKWNKKFLRAIQIVLNSMHGPVMPGTSYFYKAFGRDIGEYRKILLMPEDMIFYRLKCEETGITAKWEKAMAALSDSELTIAQEIIFKNGFDGGILLAHPPKIAKFLSFYVNRLDSEGKVKKVKQPLLPAIIDYTEV